METPNYWIIKRLKKKYGLTLQRFGMAFEHHQNLKELFQVLLFQVPLTEQQLMREKLTIQVFDAGGILRNSLIGSFPTQTDAGALDSVWDSS